MSAATATCEHEATTDAEGEAELLVRAVEWMARVSAHRKKLGLLGRIGSDVVRTEKGLELHLSEETTFRSGAKTPDPLAAALAWVGGQAARRAEYGSSGTFRIESTDKSGVTSFARVIEVTVISRPKREPDS